MNKNLLIVGAGIYSLVAFETAVDMGCFEKIDFVDDLKTTAINGKTVVGTTKELEKLSKEYSKIIVAIGNPETRISLLEKIEKANLYEIVSLISPKAYISPTAKIMEGCVIEPMAAIQSAGVVERGCFISSGAVVNHASRCCQGVHIDCNATVAGMTLVPQGVKVKCGQVYDNSAIDINSLSLKK